MASYRLAAQVIGRSSGRSSTAAAAYRAGELIIDERTGEAHDYTRKTGVLHTEIMAPANAPEWMRDRTQLWNAVELAEKRKNSQLARELQLNLPHELDYAQNHALIRSFVQREFVARGMIADLAIHAPSRRGDERNTHAHVMLTMRTLTSNGFDTRKTEEARAWNSTDQLEQWREAWAHYQNREFERLGLDVRVDHRSYERQGIDREPEVHLGPIASEFERGGKPTEKGDKNRDIAKRNAERERMDAEYFDLQEERERRQFEAMDAEGRRIGQQQEKDSLAERRRGRFEEWTNKRQAELHLKQLDARRAVEGRHSAEMAQHRARMSELYGRDRQALEKQVASLEERGQVGGVRGFLHRITGRQARDAESRERMGLTIANLKQREAEATGMIETRHREALAAIDQRLKQERDMQAGHIRAYGVAQGILPKEEPEMYREGKDGRPEYVDSTAPERKASAEPKTRESDPGPSFKAQRAANALPQPYKGGLDADPQRPSDPAEKLRRLANDPRPTMPERSPARDRSHDRER